MLVYPPLVCLQVKHLSVCTSCLPLSSHSTGLEPVGIGLTLFLIPEPPSYSSFPHFDPFLSPLSLSNPYLLHRGTRTVRNYAYTVPRVFRWF